MKKKTVALLLTGVLAVAMLAGCGTKETAADTGSVELETTTETTEESVELMVAAAASLKNAYEDELIPMFEEEYPNITVTGTYDSSGKLQTQIEEGLAADIFMSAATKQMTALDEEDLIESDTINNLLLNKIVLIVPAGSTELTSFEDIANASSIALGDPASVPAGQYAQEALTSLNLWDSIQEKVSFATNVTEVLNQVAAGSADAGIVYATDAASMPDEVTVVAEAPSGSLAEDVIYPVAITKNTTNQDAAKQLLEFLESDAALKVFESYGFTINE